MWRAPSSSGGIARLAAVKQKLVAGRDTCLLFDTPRVVRGLEDLYRQMWAEYEGGRLPVPDLRGLAVGAEEHLLGEILHLAARAEQAPEHPEHHRRETPPKYGRGQRVSGDQRRDERRVVGFVERHVD